MIHHIAGIMSTTANERMQRVSAFWFVWLKFDGHSTYCAHNEYVLYAMAPPHPGDQFPRLVNKL